MITTIKNKKNQSHKVLKSVKFLSLTKCFFDAVRISKFKYLCSLSCKLQLF